MATRGRRGRGWFGRLVGWIVKAILIFLVGSLLWVLAYRFVNPPITFSMIGVVAVLLQDGFAWFYGAYYGGQDENEKPTQIIATPGGKWAIYLALVATLPTLFIRYGGFSQATAGALGLVAWTGYSGLIGSDEMVQPPAPTETPNAPSGV